MDSCGIYRLANTMDYYQIIAERFQGTLESVAMSVDQLAGPIGQASELLTGSLLQDRKIIVCGNGVDAALAQLFTTCLMDRLDHHAVDRVEHFQLLAKMLGRVGQLFDP